MFYPFDKVSFFLCDAVVLPYQTAYSTYVMYFLFFSFRYGLLLSFDTFLYIFLCCLCLGLAQDGTVVEGAGAPEASACAIHLGLRKVRPSAR